MTDPFDPTAPFEPPDLAWGLGGPPATEADVLRACEKAGLTFVRYENRLIVVQRPDGLFGLVDENGDAMFSGWALAADPQHGIDENGRIKLDVGFGMPSGIAPNWRESLLKVRDWRFGQSLNWLEKKNWRD